MDKKRHPGRTIVLMMVFLLLIILIGNYTVWDKKYNNRVYPNVMLGDVDLSGKNFAEAKEVISEKIKALEKEGLRFIHNEKETTIASVVSSFDSDLSSPTLFFDINKTTAQAFNNKAKQSFWEYIKHKFKDQEERRVFAVYTLDEEKIREILKEEYSELYFEATNAHFYIDEKLTENNGVKINTERIGKDINWDKLLEELNNNLANILSKTIIIKTHTQYPEVREQDLFGLEKEAQLIAKEGNLYLNHENRKWVVKPSKLITWVLALKQNGNTKLSLDREKIEKYLTTEVAPEINKEVVRPKFEIEEEKVASWIIGKDGLALKIGENVSKINTEILKGIREIELETEIISNDEYVPESGFQIKEIIGTGHSDFSGSPSNRRHNIKVGADAVHGTLIKPGEEFSLIGILGDIDETSDYLPELVIKDNKTIPEYGGGLCQIGTTMFRVALSAGLPITARRNHSYRVSYYEPAGMDAAIYDPWPDVRFINDTGNYILAQSRIENKNDLYFDFWGVSDGRIASTTQPVISNIVKPEPTKLIETTELPPGEKKCTEHSHNGADAYFDYTVTYPEGATTTPAQEVRFSSHYVPWQEVCLVGIDPETASSTEEILEEETSE